MRWAQIAEKPTMALLGPHAPRPLVSRAVLGLQHHVAHRWLAQIEQEARRALEGIVEDVVASGHQPRGLERLPLLVDQLDAAVEAGLQILRGKGIGRDQRRAGRAKLDEFASFHPRGYRLFPDDGINDTTATEAAETRGLLPPVGSYREQLQLASCARLIHRPSGGSPRTGLSKTLNSR